MLRAFAPTRRDGGDRVAVPAPVREKKKKKKNSHSSPLFFLNNSLRAKRRRGNGPANLLNPSYRGEDPAKR